VTGGAAAVGEIIFAVSSLRMPAIAASRGHVVGHRFGLLPILNPHGHSGCDRNRGELLVGPLTLTVLAQATLERALAPLEVIGTARAGGAV
jgi:hypothetical protein